MIIVGPWKITQHKAKAAYGSYTYMVEEYYRWPISDGRQWSVKVWYDDTKRQYNLIVLGKFSDGWFEDAKDAMRYFDEELAPKLGIKTLTQEQVNKIQCME